LSEPRFPQDLQDCQDYSHIKFFQFKRFYGTIGAKEFLPRKILPILKILTKSWFRHFKIVWTTISTRFTRLSRLQPHELYPKKWTHGKVRNPKNWTHIL